MQEFILPDIGEGIVECELLEWLVSEGQVIQEDDPVAEVMTDKATVQISAMHSGTVAKLHYKVGDIAKVHAPLFALIPCNSAVENTPRLTDAVTQQPSPDKGGNPPLQALNTSESQISHQDEIATQTAQMITDNGSPKALASPAVRRIAKEQGIDIQTVTGSGKKGRVLKEDLLSEHRVFTEAVNADTEKRQTTKQQATDRVEPLRGMQAAMAKHMLHSVQTIPHFSVTDECAIQPLLDMKAALQPEFALHDIKLTLLPFMIKALSLALQKYPIINSQVSADMREIVYRGQHNIGFAVDSPHGLFVPNIKDVAHKSLFEIAQQVQDVIKLAQAGKLTATDLQEGTITISNIGSIGGLVATPVINHPEVAIVAIGKIQRLPRFDDQGNVFSQATMNVSWSGDHRIIDGATMVKFNNHWLTFLQEPIKMLAHLR